MSWMRHAVLKTSRLSNHLVKLGQVRCMSAGAERVLVNLDDKTGIATMQLNRPPVNSLNLEFLTDILITLEKLENNRQCRGLILTSSNNKVFCAGLDIMELYKPNPDRLKEFWRTLQGVWMGMYNTRLATVAAINGHSPAGGCLLAMSCDYRMMAPNFTIGLNETQLGIIPPFWFIETMMNVVGHRQAELCCEKGLMLTTDQAFKIGLVDEMVPPEVIQEKAVKEMGTWLKLPDFARQLTKTQLRKPSVDRLMSRREEDIDHFVNFISKDSVQKTLEFYIEQLKNKNKNKK